MQLVRQRIGAAERPNQAAPYLTHVPDDEGRQPDASAEVDPPLAALRRQFAPFGLTVHRMLGNELALTGHQLSRMVPDARCAWLLLRQMKGAT